MLANVHTYTRTHAHTEFNEGNSRQEYGVQQEREKSLVKKI